MAVPPSPLHLMNPLGPNIHLQDLWRTEEHAERQESKQPHPYSGTFYSNINPVLIFKREGKIRKAVDFKKT